MVEQEGAKVDSTKIMSLLRGHTFTSPRGPIGFDVKTGEILQGFYIQQARLVNGKMRMVFLNTFPIIGSFEAY